MELELSEIRVRSLDREDEDLARDAFEMGHYLGDCQPAYRRMYQVAEYHGEIVAALLWDQCVKHNPAREAFIGWDAAARRIHCTQVVNNKRFCIAPKYVGVSNLGSRILGLAIKDLPKSWEKRYGEELLLCETFVDPERYDGTSYKAAGWQEIGLSAGYEVRDEKSGKKEKTHPKKVFVKELRPDAKQLLCLPYRFPGAGSRAQVRLDFSKLDLAVLRQRLAELPDYRRLQGQRYELGSLLSSVLLAHMVGYSGSRAIADWLAGMSIEFSQTLGFRRGVPSEATIRRFLVGLNVERFEQTVYGWLEEQTHKLPPEQRRTVSFDGKVLRGSGGATRPAMQLLSAVVAPIGVVIGQAEVSKKTNEIPVARAKLLPGLSLEGKVAAADALHTQRKSGDDIVVKKKAIFSSVSRAIKAI